MAWIIDNSLCQEYLTDGNTVFSEHIVINVHKLALSDSGDSLLHLSILRFF